MARNRRAFLGIILSPALVPLVGVRRASSAGSHALLTPEEEEGPFYIAGERIRRSIAEGHPGVPLEARIRVLDVRTGMPIPAAAVDIWQCDALGEYSGYDALQPPPPFGAGTHPMGPPPAFDRGPGGPGGPGGAGGPGHAPQTNRKTFLRGIQLTDRFGMVRFSTIFPGFYQGRTNHIHIKVHLDASQTSAIGRVVHTGQMFFPEDLARAISEREPYANHHIDRTTQQMDHVFMQQHGASSLARVVRSTHLNAGYVASLTVVVRRVS